ncbi:MAG: hypothetical protein Q9174_006634 [Haloplaca sp. 1 TL-2023]
MSPSLTKMSLWLLVVMPAGYYLWSHLLKSTSSFFALSSLSSTQATDVEFAVDLDWHPPVSSNINSLHYAINGTGTYGLIYNSSTLPAGTPYGTYNWCNMPHIRLSEYPQVNSSYNLEYVEVIHRHHKRTPYAANTFPVETYPWYCDDEALFFYGSPLPTNKANNRSANAYWSVYTSPSNPLTPRGFNGTCQFPQITRGGLDDSYQHGADLYAVYHSLLGFLPEKYDPDRVSFRVTNNVITSQVASMVTAGMYGDKQNFPLLIQPASIDSLEPAYPCPAATKNFSTYGPGSSDENSSWTAHLNAASDLYAKLDAVSGVAPTDPGFHMSVDHYFDNLSVRLCHAKPLPCGNASNPHLCLTQEMADTVFRLGQWEYSYLYRDAGPRTLAYSVGRYGIWIAELVQNLRDAMVAASDSSSSSFSSSEKRKRRSSSSGIVKYRHNIAHDGSISHILNILQVESMVWPGMGSEIVFELYKRKSDQRFFIRVLWGGQVLRSSHPTLGRLDMVRVEILSGYFDGLVGQGAEKLPGFCGGA